MTVSSDTPAASPVDSIDVGEGRHTPGPWPLARTGDGKRIIVGEGLVEGPNGYEVAEVYADDCPPEVAEANARLIAAAPDLLEAAKKLSDGWLVDEHENPEYCMSPEHHAAISALFAAISRAEGRS